MIILLSGSINAGKTTVSKQLVRLLPLEESIPLNLANAVAVTRNFVASGLNVVISCPLHPDDYDTLIRELSPPGVPIQCVTLNPDLATILTDRGTRPLTEWELRRIPYHYETGINSPPFGIVTDNTRQTPEETAREIVSHIIP